jgi:serine phosphatase RsbU (regulator of sigma subunit)
MKLLQIHKDSLEADFVMSALRQLKRPLPTERAIFWHCVFIALLAFALLASVSGMVYALAKTALINEIRDGLKRTALVAAASVDGDGHSRFSDPAQEQSDAYLQAILPLQKIIYADDQIAFAYSAVLRDGRVYFVLDATPAPAPGQEDDSVAIMQLYDPPPPDLVKALREQSAVVTEDLYTDEWGTFISAYAPIRQTDGTFVGSVGVDLKVDNYQARLASIQKASYFAAAASALIAIMIGLAMYWQKKTDRNIILLGRQFRITDGLLNVTQAMGASVGLTQLMPMLVQKASQVMNAKSAKIFIAQEQGRFHSWQSGNEVLTSVTDESLRLAVEPSVTSLEDASVNSELLQQAMREGELRVQTIKHTAVMASPIVDRRKQAIGVLELTIDQSDGVDDDDEVLLTALGAQAKVAIERDRLTNMVVKQRQFEESLKFAQTIQLGMLPKVPEQWRALGFDLAAGLWPAKMIGGDFYDFFELEHRKLCLVIADVSGKGVPAALFMAKAMTLIRAFASVGRSPQQILHAANEELCMDNAGSMFVTVFVAIWDRTKGEMCYANGGHNAPLLVRQRTVRELTDACSVPLGTMAGMSFEETNESVQPGDLLYLFTDGVNEAMNITHDEFGDKRTQALVSVNADVTSAALIENVLDALRVHAGSAEQSDDITMLVLKVDA